MRLATIFVFTAALALSGCGKKNPSGAEGYTITPPPGWQKQDVAISGFSGVAYLAPVEAGDTFRQNINIIAERSGMSAKAYAENAKAQLPSVLKEFKLLESGSEQLGGESAVWMIYTHAMDGKAGKVLQYIVAKGSKTYIITCTTSESKYESSKETFLVCIRSIKFD